MNVRYCDRDGVVIPTGGGTLTWNNGRRQVTSDLCESCQQELLVWFGKGNPAPQLVEANPVALQSADVLLVSAPAPVDAPTLVVGS